jgi:UDP-N-acetylmuramoyl-tripeptide--D-alanyl-D-alanine ligase
MWTIEQITQWVQGKVISQHQKAFSAVGTDTRQRMDGQLFVALKGDNFDAHDFLPKAIEQGAAGLIIHRESAASAELRNKVTIILVDDTLTALQKMAAGYRRTLETKIIGITGSNGKTTTKEFTATLLSQKSKTHYNKGSFNNHWGVPLTLLQIQPQTAFAVIEMGMNHHREITRLVEIADPDYVVCTMVGRAHIENFGSLKEIAKAKAEIYQASREDTVRIFNQDQDETFDMMYPVAKKFPASRMLTFSQKNNEADVYFKLELQTPQGLKISGSIAGFKGQTLVPLFGGHNLTNLMAAACLAYACGLKAEDIWQALPLCKSTWGRNEFIKTKIGVDILFDGYNANPDSMRALLDALREVEMFAAKGPRIGVFGQMKELGAHAVNEHVQLGEAVAQAGFDFVFFVGENFRDFERGLQNRGFKSYKADADLTETLGQNFLKQLSSQALVVIKGSRGARTERFVELCEPVDWSIVK